MINSIRFFKGYPSRFSLLGRRPYTFNDRLNIIIGPNGSGKTTLLRYLAMIAGCGSGGWNDESNIALPFEIEMEWDRKPVYYQDCYADSEKSFLNDSFFQEMKYLRSTGEKRIGLINELINHLENRFLTYRLKKDEKPTLILDEVDNHIGFAGQSIFWKSLIPLLIKKYQLIVSTHSIFPILLKKNNLLRQDNFIILYRNYDYLCVKELSDAIGFFNSREGVNQNF